MHCGPAHQLLHLPHFRMPHSLHLPHFHFPHNPMHGPKKGGEVPKGCLAVYVGQEEEEQQRFVIPVIYVNHPLFEKLLKEAEEEYGFEYEKGIVTIPCEVAVFERVQELIHKEFESAHSVGCFRSTPRPWVSTVARRVPCRLAFRSY